MRIPFEIKYRPQIESGEYRVETQAGCPVRIVCWDMACELPILGLVLLNDEKAEEMAVGFTNEGTNLLGEPLYDKLFIITPEPELSEFENKLRVICEDAVRESQLFPERTSEDFAKKHSAELLDLARKELEQEWPSIIQAQSFNAGLKQGKVEALKDVPRWKISLPEPGKRYVLLFNGGSIVESRDYRRGNFYYEDGEQYKNIEYNPKCVRWMYAEELYQLPGGFKED